MLRTAPHEVSDLAEFEQIASEVPFRKTEEYLESVPEERAPEDKSVGFRLDCGQRVEDVVLHQIFTLFVDRHRLIRAHLCHHAINIVDIVIVHRDVVVIDDLRSNRPT